MRVLLIHQDFLGQFRSIAQHLARDPGVTLLAIGKQGCPQLAGVRTRTYDLHRAPGQATHHYVKPFKAAVLHGHAMLHGQAVLRLLRKLKSEGFVPDVVLGHPGWGETLYVKDVFPRARQIHFAEFYCHAQGADAGFDPEFPMTLDDAARGRSRNAHLLLSMDLCDAAIAPTQWQKSLHPPAYHDKIDVIHEGVDTASLRPDPQASFTLASGKVLRPGDPVVTYVARNLEPYRGFHTFMRAVPHILAQHGQCDIVIVGGDDVSYGSKLAGFSNWRSRMQSEVSFDAARVHFLGQIPYARYRSLLQVSKAHIYLTYPFVLSWSMLEAMACGCAVIASDTAPVREVILDGTDGLLVDFFDAAAIAGTVNGVLRDMACGGAMRQRAAHAVRDRYGKASVIAAYRLAIGLGHRRAKDHSRAILRRFHASMVYLYHMNRFNGRQSQQPEMVSVMPARCTAAPSLRISAFSEFSTLTFDGTNK